MQPIYDLDQSVRDDVAKLRAEKRVKPDTGGIPAHICCFVGDWLCCSALLRAEKRFKPDTGELRCTVAHSVWQPYQQTWCLQVRERLWDAAVV